MTVKIWDSSDSVHVIGGLAVKFIDWKEFLARIFTYPAVPRITKLLSFEIDKGYPGQVFVKVLVTTVNSKIISVLKHKVTFFIEQEAKNALGLLSTSSWVVKLTLLREVSSVQEGNCKDNISTTFAGGLTKKVHIFMGKILFQVPCSPFSQLPSKRWECRKRSIQLLPFILSQSRF